MKMKFIIFSCLWCYFYSSYGQSIAIKNPSFEEPDMEIYSVFQDDKILNPTLLNGKVKEVVRQFTQHKSIYSSLVPFVHTYIYHLNLEKKVTGYKSPIPKDIVTISSLNREKNYATFKDTLLHLEHKLYTFQNGLLVLEKEDDSKTSIKDSIVYQYNNFGKLITVQYYSAYVKEEKNIHGKNMLDPYECKFIESATYNAKNQILEKNKYIFGYESVEHYQSVYRYNDQSLLESFQYYYKNYDAATINPANNPKQWVLKEIESEDYNPFAYLYYYTYNSSNDLTQINHKIYDNYGKKGQLEIENTKKSITHNYIAKTKVIEAISTKKSSPNYVPIFSKKITELELDNQDNPIKSNCFIIKGDRKILDKTTQLQITYY